MSIEARAAQYGKLFGNWKIREFIGEGSYGKTGVFRIIKSFDDFHDENALKVVTVLREGGWPEELTDEKRREYQARKAGLCARAVNEVKLMNRLSESPYVVSYQNWEFCDWEEAGQFGCDLLIQMPMLTTLRKLQRRQFGEDEIRRVGLDICKALVRCGEEGVLHRDIKPENIFIAPKRKENYMLGDFGISRIVENGVGASTSMGTEDYAAPEQFGAVYDSRVDIYSLGLTLYELANGNRLPFREPGRDGSEAAQKRRDGCALPTPGGVGPELARVILKACAFRPEDRYQTAGEFLAALEGVQPGTAAAPGEEALLNESYSEPCPKRTIPTLDELDRRARQGDASAQFNAGLRYYSLGADMGAEGYDSALTWFLAAARQGNICAKEMLNWAIPLDELDRRARQGDVWAQLTLGMRYYRGIGAVQSYDSALTWFLAAAKQGSTYAREMINWAIPLDELARRAQHGDVWAQFALGMRYYRGVGAAQSYDSALTWFLAAARQGNTHAMAMINFAVPAERVGNLEKDIRAAFDRALQAAEHGDPDSMWELGHYYRCGRVVAQDLDAAAGWFRKGAELGSAEAMYDLAMCYLSGLGVEVDSKQAERWIERAADHGYAPIPIPWVH